MNDALRFVMNTGTVAKVVLMILAILSIVSWAIIFEKIIYLTRMGRESKRFKRLYLERAGWNSLYKVSRSFKFSPYPHIFRKGYSEFYAWKRQFPVEVSPSIDLSKNTADKYPSTLAQIVEAAKTESLAGADKYLVFLSVTISVSPFLGLFGTVWGVMSAFMSIGITGSADISTVGPGIAEALITTVTGLAVAIPALMAYNFFVSKLRRLEDQLDVFSTELVRLFEREKAL